jgi:hypothetical protein
MRVSWLGGLVVVAAGVAPAGADEWSRQYAVKARPAVHVRADDAGVRVETGAVSEVAARVTTTGWKIGPGDVVITESQSGDTVDIEIRLPKMRMGWGDRSVEVSLRVPAESDLDIRTGDGTIDARAVNGRIKLSTGDGNLTAHGLQGEIQLHSGDGTIAADGLSGRLAADTGDGDLDVRGRFVGLDLRTGDGDIQAAVEAGSKLEAPWSVRTGDGRVTLRLPEGLGAELDLHTGDGGIVLDQPVSVHGEVRENRVRGQLGAGGPLFSIHTGDGPIRVSGL